MVAETLTAARGKAGFPVGGKGEANTLKCAYGTYEIAANVEDGDIFEMCRLPAGAVVIDGFIRADDLDTNATETLDMDIGWAANGVDAADPDGFGNLGVWTGDAVANWKPEVMNYFALNGVLKDGPKTFTVETVIQIEANAAAATGGTGTLTVAVYYLTP